MGLDWMLNDKPKPGVDIAVFDAALAALNANEDDALEDGLKEAYKAVAHSTYDTLGVPQVGISEAATKHFIEVIVPSHREGIEHERQSSSPKTSYIAHWTGTDEELLARNYGIYLPEMVDEYENISTITAWGPFRAMAGAFSFRGKAVGYCELLNEDLQNEAYGDMDPPAMADYASRIERVALSSAVMKLTEAGFPGSSLLADPLVAREWMEGTMKASDERAKDAGYVDDEFFGWLKPDDKGKTDGFSKRSQWEHNPVEILSFELRVVLDGARWLRFWADLGHSMHAWS